MRLVIPTHSDIRLPLPGCYKSKVCSQNVALFNLLCPHPPSSVCRPVARVWTVVLLLGTCLLYCARVAMPICAVSMAKQFSWSKRESGMVLGSFFWGYCFTQVFGGYVSDR